jgi:hypothetical protein
MATRAAIFGIGVNDGLFLCPEKKGLRLHTSRIHPWFSWVDDRKIHGI